MRVILPNDIDNTQLNLFRTTTYYPWNFWHKFGWFPDRDGSIMMANNHEYWIETDRELTREEKYEIYNFFDEESTFGEPSEFKMELDIDYSSLQNKANKALKDSDLEVKYVGDRSHQYFYCSREPTKEEEDIIKEVWISMINKK